MNRRDPTEADELLDDELALIAESFVEQHQRGELPDVEDFARQYPQWESQIRDLFPTLVALEKVSVQNSAEVIDDSLVGSTLGDYAIEGELGRGGMGVVYQAYQISLNRKVALKVLPRRRSQHAKAAQRFDLEAQAAASLNHKNIVPVYEIGEHETGKYYAMQLIHGLGLDAVLKQLQQIHSGQHPSEQLTLLETQQACSLVLGNHDKSSNGDETVTMRVDSDTDPLITLPEDARLTDAWNQRSHYFRSVARIAADIASALDYAHDRGVLHRDIKPSNLLLDSEANVWITDFGLAKTFESDLTQTGDVVGTLSYMPPERFRGWSDNRSDIYSLGITLYELLVLQPAHASSDRAALMNDVIERSPSPPRSIDRRVPSDLETIVLKAIEKEPARRYESAKEMAIDLERFLEDRPILARQVTSTERAMRWCRRNPAVTLLLLALVIMCILAVSSARTARSQAKKARTAHVQAEGQKKMTRQALVQSQQSLLARTTAKGVEAQEELDLLAASLWHTESLRLAASQGWDLNTHRLRLAQTLQSSVQLKHAWRVDNRKYGSIQFSPTGKFLVLSQKSVDELRPSAERSQKFCVVTVDGLKNRTVSVPADINDIAISPTGPFIAVACDDGLCRVLNLESDHLPIEKALGKPARSIEFSRDGRFVVAASSSYVRVWDTSNWSIVQTIDVPSGAMHASFSPDTKLLVIAGPKLIVARLSDGSTVRSKNVGRFATRRAYFAREDRIIATTKWGRVAAMDLQLNIITSGSVGVYGNWKPRGSAELLFSVAHVGPSATVYDLSGEAPPVRVDHGASIVHSQIDSRDGLAVTCGRDGAVRIWNASGELACGILKHHCSVRAAAVSPRSRFAASFDSDGWLRLWRIQTTMSRNGPANLPVSVSQLVACSASGQAAFRSSNSIGLINLANQQVMWRRELNGRLRRIAFNKGRLYCVVDDELREFVVDNTGHAKSRSWRLKTATIYRMQMSPSCRFVALVGLRTVIVLDLDKDEFHEAIRLKTQAGRVVFSPDETYLAISESSGRTNAGKRDNKGNVLQRPYEEADGELISYNVRTREVAWRRTSPDAFPCYVDYDNSGKLLLVAAKNRASAPQDAWIVESRSGRVVATFRHQAPITQAIFSPDGKTVLTCSDDATARLWDLSGKPLTPPLRHTVPVEEGRFSNDGTFVATRSSRQAVRIWVAATGELVAVIPPFFEKPPPVKPSVNRQIPVRRTSSGRRPIARALNPSKRPKKKPVAKADQQKIRTTTIFEVPRVPMPPRASPCYFAFVKRRLVVIWRNGRMSVRDLSLDGRSVSDLVNLTQFLSGRRINEHGSVEYLEDDDLVRLWDHLEPQWTEGK